MDTEARALLLIIEPEAQVDVDRLGVEPDAPCSTTECRELAEGDVELVLFVADVPNVLG